jgi:hypothetical protein
MHYLASELVGAYTLHMQCRMETMENNVVRWAQPLINTALNFLRKY